MEPENQKIKYHRHACPNCGTFVDWKRLYIKAWLSAKWKCPACKTELCFSKKRRILLTCIPGGIWAVICYPDIMRYYEQNPLAFMFHAILVVLGMIAILPFDKIEVRN